MEKVSIELTREQRARLAEGMGVVCDELILSSLTANEKEVKVKDLGENLILAMTGTWTTS